MSSRLHLRALGRGTIHLLPVFASMLFCMPFAFGYLFAMISRTYWAVALLGALYSVVAYFIDLKILFIFIEPISAELPSFQISEEAFYTAVVAEALLFIIGATTYHIAKRHGRLVSTPLISGLNRRVLLAVAVLAATVLWVSISNVRAGDPTLMLDRIAAEVQEDEERVERLLSTQSEIMKRIRQGGV